MRGCDTIIEIKSTLTLAASIAYCHFWLQLITHPRASTCVLWEEVSLSETWVFLANFECQKLILEGGFITLSYIVMIFHAHCSEFGKLPVF